MSVPAMGSPCAVSNRRLHCRSVVRCGLGNGLSATYAHRRLYSGARIDRCMRSASGAGPEGRVSVPGADAAILVPDFRRDLGASAPGLHARDDQWNSFPTRLHAARVLDRKFASSARRVDFVHHPLLVVWVVPCPLLASSGWPSALKSRPCASHRANLGQHRHHFDQ